MKKILILCLAVIVSFTGCKSVRNEENDEDLNLKTVTSYLEQEYNEEFNNIMFIKSFKNSDRDVGLDGSVFWTVKGKGYTNFYKVYSAEDDIEFEIVYNTDKNSIGDNIRNTYKSNLKIREAVLSLYSKVQETFGGNVEYCLFTEDLHNIEPYRISSENDIRLKLSKLKQANYNHRRDIGSFEYVALSIKINEPALDFCKSNYNMLNSINNFIIETNSNLPNGMLDFSIKDKNNVSISFNGVNNKIRIYDKFENDNVWGEELEVFIQREEY